MIEGFDDHTAPLNSLEMKCCNIIAESFRKWYVGKEKAVTSSKIQKGMLETFHIAIDCARIRKIISHIRCAGIIPNLMASSKGYYIEHDKDKLKEYVGSLRSRARSINNVADSIEKFVAL